MNNKQIISDIKNIILNAFTIVPLFQSSAEQKSFIEVLVKKIASMMQDKTFYLYTAHDLEDQEKFYTMFKFDNAIIESIKPGTEFELKNYVGELQEEAIQEGVVNEILKDNRCWMAINSD